MAEPDKATVDLKSLAVTLADVQAAAVTIGNAVIQTACDQSRTLSEVGDRRMNSRWTLS